MDTTAKVRRLYDVANVLASLKLIEKIHMSDRKPAFKWCGVLPTAAEISLPLKKRCAKRASSTEDCMYIDDVWCC